MRRLLIPLLALPFVLAGRPLQALDPVLSPAAISEAKRLQSEARAGSGAFDLVRSLVVEAGPRPAGSAGDRAAVAWAERTMLRLGLKNVRRQAVSVPRWERGVAEAAVVSPFPQRLELVALGGSVGTPDGGLEGEVVPFADLAALEAAPAERVTGRLVYLGTRMERARDGAGYGKVVRNRSRGASVAARKGAVGVLIRSAGTSAERFAHTGGVRYEEGTPRIPAAALANVDSDLLEAELASAQPVRVRFRLGCRDLPDGESANVIGEVVGRELPQEIVLLAAHLDSWDLGHGAVDDGAGVAVVLSTARLLATLPEAPRRTVRVVLYANEEHGLSGGRAYAAAEGPDGAARHQLAVESDLGAGRVFRFDTQLAAADLPLAEAIQTLLAPLGVEAGSREGGGGADISPLAPFGVPFAGLAPDATRYFDVHHTANDTLAQIVPEDLDQHAAAFVTLAFAAAETPRKLARRPPPPPRTGSFGR